MVTECQKNRTRPVRRLLPPSRRQIRFGSVFPGSETLWNQRHQKNMGNEPNSLPVRRPRESGDPFDAAGIILSRERDR